MTGSFARRTHLVLPLVLAALVASSCGDPELPPVAAEMWPFRIRSYEPIDDCSLDLLQRHYDLWSSRLNIEVPPGTFITIAVVDPVDEFCPIAGAGPLRAAACVSGQTNVVYTPVAYDSHELIHAYLGAVGSHGPALFEEGLAKLGECEGLLGTDILQRSIDLVPLMETDALWSQASDAFRDAVNQAADFTRYLIDALGWQGYMDLYTSMRRGDSLQAIDSAFLGMTGLGVKGHVDAWLATPLRTRASLCEFADSCDITPIPTEVSLPFQCMPGSIGSLSGLATVIDESVPVRTTLTLNADAATVTSAALFTCGGPLTYELIHPIGPTVLLWDQSPGRYRLEVYETGEPSSPTSGRVQVTSLAVDRCTQTPTIDASAIDLVEYRQLDPEIPSLGGIDAVIRLSSSVPRSANVFAEVGTSDLWWCTDNCVARAPCVPILEGGVAVNPITRELVPGAVHSVVIVKNDPLEPIGATIVVFDPP